MKALSLFLVLVLAKVAALWGRDVPPSMWSLVAYFWQDALVAFVFGLFELVCRRAWVSWAIYAVLAGYTAINIPLVRLLSTPMTWSTMRAARGTLADSIEHHLTAGNLLLIVAFIAVAALLPVATGKLPHQRKVRPWGAAFALTLVVTGPSAVGRVDTGGLHRNAVVALLRSGSPRVRADYTERDWRRSPCGSVDGEDLTALRGTSAGRNVVMIHLESTGARYLRPYGAAEDPMPNLTRLAESAVLFENAYAVYPESIKGLFSVLCSRYPAVDTEPEQYASVATPAIAEVLALAGYRTALFHSGRFAYLGMVSIIRNRGYEVLEDAGAISGSFNSSFGVDEPATVKRILTWIDSVPRNDRFFITYLPIAGHHPYDTPGPRPFRGHAEIDRYRNALYFADTALGELLEGFKQRGLDTNTLFVIFGDHGEAFGQHEGNFAHTFFIYDENVRVPFVIAAPASIRAPMRVTRPASLIDTAPTILDLLGLKAPADYQGHSLLDKPEPMALFFTDYSLGWLGLRDGSWKFICELESGRAKLFDLSRDPDEKADLAKEFPARVEKYREHLSAWSAAQRALLTRSGKSVRVARRALPSSARSTRRNRTVPFSWRPASGRRDGG